MEITGIVLKVKNRYTRIRLTDGTKLDLMYRKSDNYIVSGLNKGSYFKGTVKVKRYTLWRMRVVAYYLRSVTPLNA